jgi:hypothetical protein
MGLKGCRLWVMGQLVSNVQRPTSRCALMGTCEYGCAFHSVHFDSRHQLMTAGMVHVTNRATPGSGSTLVARMVKHTS